MSKNWLTDKYAFECARPMKPYPTRPILSFFISVLIFKVEKEPPDTIAAFPAITALLFFPSVRFTDRDHSSENGIPGLLFQHHVICKHAAVPTDMLEGLRQFPLIVPKPITGIPGDV